MTTKSQHTSQRERIAARILAWAITSFARLVTAVQPMWQGVDPASKVQRIYYANHVSHGDFVLIWSVLPQPLRSVTRPIAGADYWNKGRLRRFIGEKVFNSVLIARNARETGENPVAQMVEALDTRASVIVFPEGTRNLTDADLLDFKTGLFWLANERPEIDLVPVWIDNLNRVLPKGTFIPVPLMCRVIFGAPLRLGDGEEKDAFLTRSRDALLSLKPKTEQA